MIIQKIQKNWKVLVFFIAISGFLFLVSIPHQRHQIFVNLIQKSDLPTQLYHRNNNLSQIREQYLANYTNYYDKIHKSVHILVVEAKSSTSSICMAINALEKSDQQTTKNQANNFVALMQSYSIKKQIFYFTNSQILTAVLKNINLENKYHAIDIKFIDSSYEFIQKYIKYQCQSVIISRIQHEVLKVPQIPLKQIQNSCFVFSPLQNPQLAQIINETALYEFKEQQISSFLIIVDPKYLQIITPLNFAFQNVYTFTHLLINPILAYVLHSPAFKIMQTQIHQLNAKPLDEIEFELSRLSRNINSFCFVNYPYNLKQNNFSDFHRYLNAFEIQQNKNRQISMITSLIYNKGSQIFPYVQRIFEFQYRFPIRIKLRFESIKTSLQVYEAAFIYCPSSSTIISSRQNIQLLLQTIFHNYPQGLCVQKQNAIQKIPYYIVPTSYLNQQNQTISLPPYKFYVHMRKGTRFRQQFRYMQFFCQEIMRTINLTSLKTYETDFYQSQQSFMLLIAEAAQSSHYGLANIPLFKLNYQSKPSKIQFQQQMSLKERLYQRAIRKNHRIQPIQYNPLVNRAFKRNAPELIPRIIHQIYLSSKPISQMQNRLRLDIIQKHPNFKYRLWTWNDLNRQNFPITFDIIQAIKEYDQSSDINFKASIAGIMRMEILYRFGGIYIDMKFQAKKSLIPFLKYQQLFLYMNYKQYDLQHQPIKVALNGILMTVPHSIHYLLIMQKFYKPQFFQDYFQNPSQTMVMCSGGLALRNGFSDEQLTKQVAWGQDLLKKIYPEGPCHTLVSFDENSKYYEINHHFDIGNQFQKQEKKKYITVPCEYDEDKYLEMYFELASTYLKSKIQFS